jgi:hypothetical protein
MMIVNWLSERVFQAQEGNTHYRNRCFIELRVDYIQAVVDQLSLSNKPDKMHT